MYFTILSSLLAPLSAFSPETSRPAAQPGHQPVTEPRTLCYPPHELRALRASAMADLPGPGCLPGTAAGAWAPRRCAASRSVRPVVSRGHPAMQSSDQSDLWRSDQDLWRFQRASWKPMLSPWWRHSPSTWPRRGVRSDLRPRGSASRPPRRKVSAGRACSHESLRGCFPPEPQ